MPTIYDSDVNAMLLQAKDVETTLKNVPSPIEAQVAAVEKLILEIVEEVKVTPDMMGTRKEVVKELNKLLAAKVEGEFLAFGECPFAVCDFWVS